jgi:hypothetical protein
VLPERQLRAALRNIGPVPIQGPFSRTVALHYLFPKAATVPHVKPQPLWGLGSKRFGGRYTPKNSSLGRVCPEEGDVGGASRLGDALAFAINQPLVSRDASSIAQKTTWNPLPELVARYQAKLQGRRLAMVFCIQRPSRKFLPHRFRLDGLPRFCELIITMTGGRWLA